MACNAGVPTSYKMRSTDSREGESSRALPEEIAASGDSLPVPAPILHPHTRGRQEALPNPCQPLCIHASAFHHRRCSQWVRCGRTRTTRWERQTIAPLPPPPPRSHGRSSCKDPPNPLHLQPRLPQMRCMDEQLSMTSSITDLPVPPPASDLPLIDTLDHFLDGNDDNEDEDEIDLEEVRRRESQARARCARATASRPPSLTMGTCAQTELSPAGLPI